MLRALLVCALIVHVAVAKPLQQGEAGASHIVIVTPQAQVRLEPLPAAYIQHLSPLARYAAPQQHEETIVYVPASAVGPIVPLNSVAVAARSNAAEQPKIYAYESGKQLGNITQIQDITQQIQQSAGSWGPQLSEAASSGAAAIASAGQGLFPALFPPPSTAAKIEFEAPAGTQPLIAAEARHFYAIPSGVLDFVRGPVFVTPASSVRARSIKESSPPISACSLADVQKAQEAAAAAAAALLLKDPLKQDLKELPEKELLKKPADFRRLLEDTLKDEKKEAEKLELLPKPLELKEQLPELSAANKLLEPEALPLAAAKGELPAPQLRSAGVIAVPVSLLRSSAGVAGGVVPVGVVGGAVPGGVEGAVGVPVPVPVVENVPQPIGAVQV